MAELGSVEGKNFAAEYQINQGSWPEAAAHLVRRNVNAIFASGPAALAALSKATTHLFPCLAISKRRRPHSLWTERDRLFRRCGEYVAKILQGAKPSDLPIQRPERFDLVINLKTAAAIGVDVPAHLQQLADEVIE